MIFDANTCNFDNIRRKRGCGVATVPFDMDYIIFHLNNYITFTLSLLKGLALKANC